MSRRSLKPPHRPPTNSAQSFAVAVAHHQHGRLGEAARLYGAILKAAPDHGAALCNLGILRLTQGDPGVALQLLQRALTIGPNLAEAHNSLGNALCALTRPSEAIRHFERAVALKPDYAEAHYNLANTLAALNRPGEAIAHYERALALRPGFAEAHNNFGNMLQSLNRHAEALARYEQAIALKPAFGEAHNNRGNALEVLGRTAEARLAFEAATRTEPRRAAFHLNLAKSKRFTAADPQLAALERLAAESATLAEDERIALHFALGKALGDVGRREESFRHLLAGNALKRRHIAYDEPHMLGTMRRIEAVFTPALVAAKRGLGQGSAVPVFVLGMPRSGTTLVEQILASHPQVHGAGEIEDLERLVTGIREQDGPLRFPEIVPALTGAHLTQLGADYVARISGAAPAAARIINKMPMNFLFVGLIHLMLPQARILHTRRDPLDTCLSCFSKLFTGNQPHTYDLGELGRYYRGYDALMQHWRRVLPPGVMLEVQYEDVVGDLAGEARRIVAHCGLPWDEACVDFHQTERVVTTASASQVRQPIYRTSLGRWRAYGNLLQPLFASLGIEPPSS
jgi:tetratricopeptide (TPR) repeat protein